MSLRKHLLGFLVGVFATSVMFVGLQESDHDTTHKSIEQTEAEEHQTSDGIQRHSELFWYNESAGLVDPSAAYEGWSPVDVDYLFVPFHAGNLVSIRYGSYDTNVVGGSEYVEILIQLPIEAKTGDEISLRPVGQKLKDVEGVYETRELFLPMKPGEIAIHQFSDPFSIVLPNSKLDSIGHCKILKMSETFVDFQLTISAVEGLNLEIDQVFSLQRKRETTVR